MAEKDRAQNDSDFSLEKYRVDGNPRMALVPYKDLPDDLVSGNLNDEIENVSSYLEEKGFDAIIAFSDTGLTLYQNDVATSFKLEEDYSQRELEDELNLDSIEDESFIDHIWDQVNS